MAFASPRPAPDPKAPKFEGRSTEISAFKADEAVYSFSFFPEMFPVKGLVNPD